MNEPKEITLGDSRKISFRPVSSDDEAFLLAVYASTRADELAMVPWNDAQREAFVKMQFAAQTLHYEAYYPEAEHDIILVDGAAVGRLYVARLDDEIRITDITILPDHRNQGIGTPIIRALMDEGAQSGKRVSIYVENFNRSLRLFERLGFRRTEETATHFLLDWTPEQK